MSRSSLNRRRVRDARKPGFENLETRALLSTFTVTNVADSGPGSLRQAIINANSNPGLDLIAFNTPGPSYPTITPLGPLPTVTDPVTIDGRSEPGAPDRPVITIDGSHAGAGANGLTLAGGQSVVRGLVIEGFDGYGVVLQGGGGNILQGNYIGTDITGEVAVGNRAGGVLILGSTNNTIGFPSSGDGNVISGNGGDGIRIVGPTSGLTDQVATGNQLLSNNIGTDSTGQIGLANAGDGIQLIRASANAIGGTGLGFGNVISGNGKNGIEIVGELTTTSSSGAFNRIQGNLIGAARDGSPTLGNGLDGIRIGGTANSIGGTVAGAANIIAANGGNGVSVLGLNIPVLSNSIYGNRGIGIDLGGDGPGTATPAGSPSGPNKSTSAPVLIGVTRNGVPATVSGTLDGIPNAAYTLQFFANPPGQSQAQIFVGSSIQTTDGKGHVGYLLSIPTGVPIGWNITATATDGDGNTSELSQPGLIAPRVVDLTMSGDRTTLTLRFDAALDPSRASDKGNYLVSTSHLLNIKSASYDAATDSVVLVMKKRLPASQFVRVTADASGAAGLTTPAGLPIDGDGDGQAGGAFTGFVALGAKLTYHDRQSHQVTLQLAKGGVLDVYRGADGDARIVHLRGVHPGKSVLKGSVKGRHATTNIGEIAGLNGAKNTLKNPPFVVGKID